MLHVESDSEAECDERMMRVIKEDGLLLKGARIRLGTPTDTDHASKLFFPFYLCVIKKVQNIFKLQL